MLFENENGAAFDFLFLFRTFGTNVDAYKYNIISN